MRRPMQLVVLGVPFEEPGDYELARKTAWAASAMTLLALVAAILQLATGFAMGFGLFSAVALPLLGYCGVQRRKRWMVQCFRFAGLILAAFWLSSTLALMIAFPRGGDVIGCLCDSRCAKDHGLTPAPASSDICEHPGKFRALWWASIALGGGMAALQIAGAVYAGRLVHRGTFFDGGLLYGGDAQEPLATAVVVEQPAAPAAPPAYYPPPAGQSAWVAAPMTYAVRQPDAAAQSPPGATAPPGSTTTGPSWWRGPAASPPRSDWQQQAPTSSSAAAGAPAGATGTADRPGLGS